MKKNAVLQEIADVIGCNRQDVIYQLIQDYTIPEWRKMKLIRLVLSTMSTAPSIIDHNIILEKGSAATFEDDYIGKINRIKKMM